MHLSHQFTKRPNGEFWPPLKNSVLIAWSLLWYAITWYTECFSAEALLMRFLLNKYSTISFSSATAKGPLRTHAASSGQPSFIETVSMDCMRPSSESSEMANNSLCWTRHLSKELGTRIASCIASCMQESSKCIAFARR